MKIIICIIISFFIWSLFIEPYILTVKQIYIKDSELKGLKVVFASDLHIKPYEMFRLKKTVKKINKQNADIVLLAGDYVSGHKQKSSMPIEKIAKELKQIKSKFGTIGILGNHDCWAGKYEIKKALEENNIKILINENICFDKFCIAGVDDMQTGEPDTEKALSNINKPVILLSHSPDIMPEVPEKVNLTLAGHLHGGQLRPGRAFIVPSKYGNKYANGYLEEDNKKIYTSKGLGNSIVPMRFNCFPEIVVINFI